VRALLNICTRPQDTVHTSHALTHITHLHTVRARSYQTRKGAEERDRWLCIRDKDAQAARHGHHPRQRQALRQFGAQLFAQRHDHHPARIHSTRASSAHAWLRKGPAAHAGPAGLRSALRFVRVLTCGGTRGVFPRSLPRAQARSAGVCQPRL
jgi:hypothetical protein